jgi:uncharacterized membrane protein
MPVRGPRVDIHGDLRSQPMSTSSDLISLPRDSPEATQSFGDRLADRVATIGGSWTFVAAFTALLAAWIVFNSVILARRAFDPYPYILLNLVLSMLATLQAPVIMMSQNRQTERDRLAAARDFEVNERSEAEIRTLQRKIDELHATEWRDLITVQQDQLRLLERLLAELGEARRTAERPAAPR